MRFLALSLACGIAVAAGGWLFSAQEPPQRSDAELMDAVMWNREPVGGRFSLTDQNGTRRTNAEQRISLEFRDLRLARG